VASPRADIPTSPAPKALEGFGGVASPWVRIESLREGAEVGWATSSIDSNANAIVIETEGARGLVLDLSNIHVDWNRRVILRIDGQGSQLLHGKSQVKHLEVSPAGRWRVVHAPTSD